MAEIAVAVLDVDEGVARVAGEPAPRRDEVLDQPAEIVVGEQAHAAGEPAIEQGCAQAVSGSGRR